VGGAAGREPSEDSDEESLLFWTFYAERFLASLQLERSDALAA
jgi:hypothetical protein